MKKRGIFCGSGDDCCRRGGDEQWNGAEEQGRLIRCNLHRIILHTQQVLLKGVRADQVAAHRLQFFREPI